MSLPHLSLASARVIDCLTGSRGVFVSSDHAAQAAGLRSRHQLSAVLRRDGLPRFSLLTGWVRTMIWLQECDQEGLSLCRITLMAERDPAYRYRLVKRIPGYEWGVLRQRGMAWALGLFLEACARPVVQEGVLIRESG